MVKLRGQSIQGQLDGTIPSTEEAQRDSDALIDASDLDLSVMGTMNMGGGNGAGGPGESDGAEPPQFGGNGKHLPSRRTPKTQKKQNIKPKKGQGQHGAVPALCCGRALKFHDVFRPQDHRPAHGEALEPAALDDGIRVQRSRRAVGWSAGGVRRSRAGPTRPPPPPPPPRRRGGG